jgi:hypothetical protein
MNVALWVSATAALALGFLLALPLFRRRERRLLLQLANTREEAERLNLQFETIRVRAAQLREQLSAADRQARL